jgi:hypothetical protein
MEKAGFMGVLLMASIPNPLFDLAGLTCGHLLFPFWKFFGATFIGKALIKSNIQAVFVVLLFSPRALEIMLADIGTPYVEKNIFRRIIRPFAPRTNIHSRNIYVQSSFFQSRLCSPRTRRP